MTASLSFINLLQVTTMY